MINKKITIGMPVFNGEKCVGQAISSLLNQTYKNFELIVSDNCSTDLTGKICKSISLDDSRLKYIRQQSNIGAKNNFLFVFSMATNEYFMWAAHDDVWHPNFLSDLIAQFNENHNVGLVYGWFNIVDPASGRLKKTVRPMPSFSDSKAINFLAEHLSPCGGKIYGLFKTELIRKFLDEDLLIDDYFDALLVDYVNLNSFTIIVPKIIFFYGEEIKKKRVSLVEGKFKIFNFDHFSYMKSCVKLIFRNGEFNLYTKLVLVFCFLFLFSTLKIRGRLNRATL